MSPRTLLSLALIFAFLPFSGARATELIRVTPKDHEDYNRLMRIAPDLRDCGLVVKDRVVEFPADAKLEAEVRAQGFLVEVVIPDMESFYAKRFTRDNNFGAYHTYDEAVQAMDALAAAHPNIMTSKFSIGTTLQGRALWVYKISDNPNVDEPEPEIFFNAYIHAREPIGFEIVYDLTQYLVNGYGSDPRATSLVNTREIFIEPVVNPDGVEYNHQTDPAGGGMWRKNRRNNGGGSYGVDLNRNFGYQWGYDNNGSSPYGSDETYRGPSAFSEPEIAGIRDFCISRHFNIVINNHSYGGYQLFPFGYTDIHCLDHEEFFAMGRMRRATSLYSTGTAWEILYATNGDANDWMYGEQGTKPKIFALVTESGNANDGFWPPESRIPALCAENREANLKMCEYADNPARMFPPGVAQASSPDTVPSNFTLTWTVPQPDADNPATTWNLIEGTGYSVGQDNLEGTNQNRWTTDGWTWSTARSHSASHSFFGGNANALNNVLISRRGHKVQAGEQLKFWTWYRMEDSYDYGYVEISTDARNFTPIPGSITTNVDPNQRNLGNGITGSSASWVQATFNLASYTGQTVWVRFRYNTDGYTTLEGWYVDDVEPSDLFSGETVVATGLTSPQYAFSNHLLGTFYYLIQSADGEGDLAVWSPPKREVVIPSADSADGDGAANVWRGLELVGANPFTRSALLRWTLPAAASLKPWALKIYDVAGRIVSDGTQGWMDQSAGRSLEYLWSPQDIPSGIYLARLKAGDVMSQRRLVYVK